MPRQLGRVAATAVRRLRRPPTIDPDDADDDLSGLLGPQPIVGVAARGTSAGPRAAGRRETPPTAQPRYLPPIQTDPRFQYETDPRRARLEAERVPESVYNPAAAVEPGAGAYVPYPGPQARIPPQARYIDPQAAPPSAEMLERDYPTIPRLPHSPPQPSRGEFPIPAGVPQLEASTYEAEPMPPPRPPKLDEPGYNRYIPGDPDYDPLYQARIEFLQALREQGETPDVQRFRQELMKYEAAFRADPKLAQQWWRQDVRARAEARWPRG